jgi:hypothetical protein
MFLEVIQPTSRMRATASIFMYFFIFSSPFLKGMITLSTPQPFIHDFLVPAQALLSSGVVFRAGRGSDHMPL